MLSSRGDRGFAPSRRTFLELLGGAVGTTLVAACGNLPSNPAPAAKATAATFSDKPGGAPPASTASGAGGNGTTLQFWANWDPKDPELNDRLLAGFEKANPSIKVAFTNVPTAATTQSSDKLVSAIKAGTPPDVSYFDRFIVTSWAAQDLLTDLTSYARSDNYTKSMFLPEAWAEATWAGKLYATPMATDFRMLYYNTNHFKEVGIDPTKPPTTIDQLDAYAEKLTKRDGSGYSRLGFVPWVYQGWLYTWGWLWGGEFYDEKANKITANDPKIVAALEWMTGYATKYGIDKVDAFTAPFYAHSGSASGPKHAFIKEQLSMICEGDWEISNFKRIMKPDQFAAFDVVVLPHVSGGPKTSTWGGGWSVVVPKGVKNLDPAWKFAHWWSTDGQKMYVRDLNRIPTLLELFDEKNFPDADPRWKKFLALRDQARFRPNLPVGQTLWTELAAAVQSAIHGQGQPKAILDGVTERVNQELKKYGG